MTHVNTPYLKHILDAITDIESSVDGLTKEEFKGNKDKKDAAIRRIEVIGEAVKNTSQDLKKKHPEVEWKKIAGSRDVMIHSYFNVDLDIVWEIIRKDLPALKKQIKQILDKSSENK